MTATPPTDPVLDETWRDHRRWSNAANALKKRLLFWRTAGLILVVFSAITATGATQIGAKTAAGRWLSFAAALTAVLAPLLRARFVGPGRIESWTRARSVSEGLKTPIYLYLTRRGEATAAEELRDRRDAILADVDDIARVAEDRPGADKPVPLEVEDIESYLTRRVDEQVTRYYRPQARRQEDRLNRFRTIELALSIAAAVLAVLATWSGSERWGSWVAVAAAVGAAITAHIAAARYEHLAITYRSTARQLEALADRWRHGADQSPERARSLIEECESVISRENESWMAAWSRAG